MDSSNAPKWFTERIDQLEGRVSAIEQMVVKGAAAKGAQAGRRWGTAAGAFIVALSSTLAQCDTPQIPDISPSRNDISQ